MNAQQGSSTGVRRTRVLVAIPTLDEATTIERVIEALHAGLPSNVDARFVVVDGGSIDGTQDVVAGLAGRYPALSLLHNEAMIQSAAVNLCVKHFGADADVLMRCDAHADYRAGYIADLVASLERHAADSIVVAMDSTGRSCLQRAIAWLSDSPLGSGGSAHRAGQRSGYVDHGHHAAFSMASFLRAGGYDTTFSHNEDAEFDCRHRSFGARIYLDASIRVDYHPRATLLGLWRQYHAYGRGRARTLRKHPTALRLRQAAIPLHLLLTGACIAVAPWWPTALAWPAFYLLGIAGTTLWLLIRKGAACALLVAPAAIVMHTAWGAGFLSSYLFSGERRWRREDVPALDRPDVGATIRWWTLASDR